MTPRMSVRARAREIYGEMATTSLGLDGQGEAGSASGLAEASAVQGSAPRESAAAPTPDPSPLLASASGGGEKEARASGEPDLTAKVRELYESSAVPVREVARIAGVCERTLYKYVEKGGWKRRYKCLARDEAVAAANRGRRWQVAPERQGNSATDISPAKGSGGRFIRREDIGKPFPTGLKALDPAGRAQALAASGAAERLSDASRQLAELTALRAELLRDAQSRVSVIRDMVRYLGDMRKLEATLKEREAALKRAEEKAKERPSPEEDMEMRVELARRIHNMIEQDRRNRAFDAERQAREGVQGA